jgi:hypothetical protein
MIFKMRTATHTKVRFLPLELIYSGPMDMLEFSLTNYTLEEGKDRKYELEVFVLSLKGFIAHLPL